MSDIIKKLASTAVVGDEHIVARADQGDLYGLLHVIREEISRRDESAIVQVVKERLKDHPEVVEVVFGVEEWDNGWFFSENAVACFGTDGEKITDEIELTDDAVAYPGNDDIHQALTELSSDYGPLTRNSELRVNVQTGTVTPD